jgi:hypothetical protein
MVTLSLIGERTEAGRSPLPPYAGVNRIRFSGSEAAASLSSALSAPPGMAAA